MTYHSRQDETAEWLNYLQPEGLVVGANVLRERGVTPIRQTPLDTEAALSRSVADLAENGRREAAEMATLLQRQIDILGVCETADGTYRIPNRHRRASHGIGSRNEPVPYCLRDQHQATGNVSGGKDMGLGGPQIFINLDEPPMIGLNARRS